MLLNQRLIFFGGKGGVGKTTLAAATALSLGDVLLVSTDPAHNIGHIFGTEVGDTPTLVEPGVSAVEIDPSATTAAHLARVEETMRRLTPERLHGQLRTHLQLASASPGTHEAAVLERLAEVILEGQSHFQHIVVDTAPTGHTTRLLALPELMGAWIDGLLGRREQSERFGSLVRGLGGAPQRRRDEEIRQVLQRRKHLFSRLREAITDPESTAFALVTVPERVPVTETLELADTLRATGIPLGGLYVNRCSPSDQGPLLASRARQEEQQLRRLAALQLPQQLMPLLGDASPRALARLLA